MQTPEFHIDVVGDTDLLVLALRGELDLSTVAEVHEALADHESPAHRAIVIDLSALQFIDSSGINFLIRLWRDRPDGVAFVAPADDVGRVLDIAGVRALLPWVDDPRDALPR
jgi:stage II sporulation protein AA (anti-sigma F factor antagonist)